MDPENLEVFVLRSRSMWRYNDLGVLESDCSLLEELGYKKTDLDFQGLKTDSDLHRLFAAQLSFPDYYGNNLDALNDCLCGLEVVNARGRILVLRNFDSCILDQPEIATSVLDILAGAIWSHLARSERMFVFVHTDDEEIELPEIGKFTPVLNHSERVSKLG